MSSTESPRRLSQKCAISPRRVAVASGRDTDGRSRSRENQTAAGFTESAADRSPSYRVQEREAREHERLWDDKMAEAMAFLISAHASLESLSGETFRDPHAERMLASVPGQVFEALSTLDDFNVTRWIKSGSLAGAGYSFAHLPIWWLCPSRWMTGGR